MSEFLLYSKFCFIDDEFIEATLHIKDGKIYQIHKRKTGAPGIPFLNYEQQHIFPGFIDAHVHINEPGREDWEGFETATKAALKGGITTLIEMPLNASPVTTTVASFDLKKKATTNKLYVNCGFYGGLIPANKNDIEDLIKSGVFGIKGFLTHSGIDEFPNITREDIEAIAPILKKYDIPLLLHCELSDNKVPKVQNTKSYQEYLHSRPQHWEVNAIKLAIDVQKKFDIKVHVVHLSASEGIELIKKRKQKTDKLTVETCPHYLYFNSEDIPDEEPIFKCAPPIRDHNNNNALWEFLLEDGFNFLASDHSPAPPERKQLASGDFFKAWGGIAGLQFSFHVLFTEAVKRKLSLEKLVPLLTENPAKFLGLAHKKGYLKEGFDADITICNTKKNIIIKEDCIAHKHKATPYLGEWLKGQITDVFVNGVHALQEKEIVNITKGELLLK